MFPMTALEEKLASAILLVLDEMPVKDLDRLVMLLLLARYGRSFFKRCIVEYSMFIGGKLYPIVPAEFYIVENRIESPDILAMVNRLVQYRLRRETDNFTLHLLSEVKHSYRIVLPSSVQERIRRIVKKHGRENSSRLWRRAARLLGIDPSRKYPPLKVSDVIMERRIKLVRKVLY